MPVPVLAQDKRAAIIAIVPIQFGRDVDIDQVALAQDAPAGRDAVTHFVVDADARPARKAILLIRRGRGAERAQDGVAVVVQLPGA